MDTHSSVLLAERIKPTRKLFSEILSTCEWTWKFASDFCASVYFTKFLPVKLQKNSHSQPPWPQYLLNSTKQKHPMSFEMLLKGYLVCDSKQAVLRYWDQSLLIFYSLFYSSIYQFYSLIMWYKHINSSPNTSKCPAFLKRYFSNSLIAILAFIANLSHHSY